MWTEIIAMPLTQNHLMPVNWWISNSFCTTLLTVEKFHVTTVSFNIMHYALSIAVFVNISFIEILLFTSIFRLLIT